MFYLYIDGLLVSSSADFNEIVNSIFNFVSKHVKIKPNNVLSLSKNIQDLVFGSLHGLINYQYDSFELQGQKVEIYYGNQE